MIWSLSTFHDYERKGGRPCVDTLGPFGMCDPEVEAIHRLSPPRSAVPDEKLWRSCLRFPLDQTGTRQGAVADKQSLHVAHNFGHVCGKKMVCWWQPGHDSVACDLGHGIRLFHCVWVENTPALIHHAPLMMSL